MLSIKETDLFLPLHLLCQVTHCPTVMAKSHQFSRPYLLTFSEEHTLATPFPTKNMFMGARDWVVMIFPTAPESSERQEVERDRGWTTGREDGGKDSKTQLAPAPWACLHETNLYFAALALQFKHNLSIFLWLRCGSDSISSSLCEPTEICPGS